MPDTPKVRPEQDRLQEDPARRPGQPGAETQPARDTAPAAEQAPSDPAAYDERQTPLSLQANDPRPADQEPVPPEDASAEQPVQELSDGSTRLKDDAGESGPN